MKKEGENDASELTMEELIKQMNQYEDCFSILVYLGEESDFNGRQESAET